MTASRTCRACGTELAPNVGWCLRCYEPVRHLTPREPQLPTIHFLTPKEEAPRSRWRAGVTTFGPVGRITITVLVLLLGPWTLNPVAIVIGWPMYLVFAILILRSTWKRDDVETPTIRQPAAAGAHSVPTPEAVRLPVPRSTIVVWAILGLLGLGVGISWAVSGDRGHAYLGIGASLATLALALRWLTRD